MKHIFMHALHKSLIYVDVVMRYQNNAILQERKKYDNVKGIATNDFHIFVQSLIPNENHATNRC